MHIINLFFFFQIRRLYDIANVLKSMGLIKKILLDTNNKPGFKWIGIPGI